MKENDFDVIVVGAGTGGCTVAKVIGNKGYSIALVDKKKKEEIGNKICGDEILEEQLLFMENIFGNLKECIENKVRDGISIFPDGSQVKLGTGNGCIFNRHKMGQIILKRTLKNRKVRLFDHTAVLDIKKNKILALNLEKKERFSLSAKIIVDASGFDAIIRRGIKLKDGGMGLKNREFAILFREIIKVKEWKDDDFCLFFFDDVKIPHGYAWIFPKGNNCINAGLGFERVVNKNPKISYNSFFNFKKLKVLSSGGGMVPLRRSISNLVDDHFLTLGDAACHASPISGGGIYNSLIAGNLAALTAIDALKKQKYDEDTLWDYNIKYQTKYGKELAKEEVIKVFLFSLNYNEIKNVMLKVKNKFSLFTFKASLYNLLNLGVSMSSMKEFHLLKKIIKVLKYTRKIDKLYKNYPTKKERLKKWDQELNDIFDHVYDDFNSAALQ
jgi:digeranylgeranylglycerophospholipid reductase